MKKLLVAVLAMATVSAYAQSHMVRFTDFSGSQNGGVDFSFHNEDENDAKDDSTHIALNYAYTVAPMWQVGLGVDYQNSDGGAGYAWTLSGYYNLSTDLANATYFGLHYTAVSIDNGSIAHDGATLDSINEDDTFSTIAVEAGKRFALGSWNGFNLSYAPSVAYSMVKHEVDATDMDNTYNDLTWNFFKFDVLF